jgi:hypothetical protein
MRLPDLAAMNCARFRCVRRGAIVRLVRVSCAFRARLVAAILSLALIYAFTCSATCANCLGSGATAATESQGCGHAAADVGSSSHHQGPAKPDCLGHHHSGFEAVQSDGLSRVRLSATGYPAQLFHGAVGAEVVNAGTSFFSDLAPPRDATIFSQQNDSILRI